MQQNVPQPPPQAQGSAQGTYLWYVSNGFPPQMAYDLTVQKFGPPKSAEEQKREAAKAAEKYGYAKIGGQLAGTLVGAEALGGFSNVKKAFGYGQAPADVGSGTIGISRSVPPPTTTIDGSGAVVDMGGGAAAPAVPKVVSVKGNVATIDTPAGLQEVPAEAASDPGFLSSVDWAKVAQGGVGALQLYQAYKSLQGGDKLGAGIYGVAGGANLAASGLAGAAAQQMAGEALGGYLLPGVNIATGLYGGYKTAEALSDMAAGKQRYRAGAMGGAGAGAAIGTAVLPGIGTAVGAAVGALAGTLGAKFGSGKGKGQVQRDAVRGALQEQGILDENFQGTLADGTVTDFGKDGSILKTSAMQKIAENNPNAYEPTVQLGDALVSAYGFLGDKNRSLGRMFVRGALSNAEDDPTIAMNNMRHFAAQQGITFDLIKSNLDSGLAENRIKEPEYNRLLSAAQQLMTPTEETMQPVKEVRPEEGKVNRLSAGLYRDASGNLVKAGSIRAALEKAYKGKQTKKNQEL